MTRLLRNLVKNRYVVENSKEARVINSNEKIEKLIGKKAPEGGFTQGIFAEKVEVDDTNALFEDYSEEEIPGLDELVSDTQEYEADYAEAEIEENIPQEVSVEELRAREEEMLQAIRQEAEMEAEEIKKQAMEEGRQQAQREMMLLREQLETEYSEKNLQLQEQYAELARELEPTLVDTILDVFQAVLKVEISDYRELILEMVKSTISNIDNPKEVTVQVSEDNFQTLKQNLYDLKEILGEEVKLEITKSSQLSDADCKIETEFGIFDCGFDTQLKNLCNRLKVLSYQKDKE